MERRGRLFGGKGAVCSIHAQKDRNGGKGKVKKGFLDRCKISEFNKYYEGKI